MASHYICFIIENLKFLQALHFSGFGVFFGDYNGSFFVTIHTGLRLLSNNGTFHFSLFDFELMLTVL